MDASQEQRALEWQVGIWDRISNIYLDEIDQRFLPVVEALLSRADLQPGEHILDLGTGTGSIADKAAGIVGPEGSVLGLDVSQEMLAQAEKRMAASGWTNVTMKQGRAEEIPAADDSFDVVLAGLSLMYVIDREAAVREIARVLRPKGRLVAAVWAGPEVCDIVLFQQTAGSFAGPPPVPGVGPGALADPTQFINQLEAEGITAKVQVQTLGFDFPDFASAWDTLAGVTTAQLSPERVQEAKEAVLTAMYQEGDGPRHFNNDTQFIVGKLRD